MLFRSPTETDDPDWPAWLNFTRESFEQYVTRYCDAVHAHEPGVLVCSNWLQTFRCPGEPKVPTDWISGDNSAVFGLDSSRSQARFISTRGKPWDLMIWAFYASGMRERTLPRTFKPVQMIQQEARLGAAARAVVEQQDARSQELRHLLDMRGHDLRLGPRGIILFQGAYLLEKLRAPLVI